MGIGKPLKSILHMNPNIPIWLGTGSESNVKLTAEIADGWFPLAFVPGMMEFYRPWLEEGFRRAGGGKSLADFEIQPGVSVIITDKIQDALDRLVAGRTVIAIAHRLSTLRRADRLLVVEDGKLVENGTHAELLDLDGGVYRKLYELQQQLHQGV